MSSHSQLRFDNLSFDQLEAYHADVSNNLRWNCPFVLPFWLKTWFSCYGRGYDARLIAVWSGDILLGIAPLMVYGGNAQFLGSESLCDYQEMIIADNREESFFSALFELLKNSGIQTLQLGALLPDSPTLNHMPGIAEKNGHALSHEEAGNLYSLTLPDEWGEYLTVLSSKQRHEVRRKMRRLRERGGGRFRIERDAVAVDGALDDFLEMFADSRNDKRQFLDVKAREYFSLLAKEMRARGMLRLGTLFIAEKPAAKVFCFVHGKEMFLYNNGYLKEYSSISAGTLSKIFSIKHSIENGLKRYNFLKGDERYKLHLGGQPLPLSRICVRL